MGHSLRGGAACSDGDVRCYGSLGDRPVAVVSASEPRRDVAVTVVVPTYNYAGVLAFAIDSVLDQTFPDYELLVVGDGCTDASEQIATQTGDPRVHWINLPRRTGHQTGPNNEALQRASGDIVAFLGHDDLWLPHHLEVLVEALDGNRGAAAAYTMALRLTPGRPAGVQPDAHRAYERGQFVPPTAFAVRRGALIAIGGWRDKKETGELLPECDLLARVHDLAGSPCAVPRITCIKLAAGERRNVYRTRPTYEQDFWLTQVRASADPERLLSTWIGRPYELAGGRVERPPFAMRVWRSVRYRVRKRLGLPTGLSANAQIRGWRRIKGA